MILTIILGLTALLLLFAGFVAAGMAADSPILGFFTAVCFLAAIGVVIYMNYYALVVVATVPTALVTGILSTLACVAFGVVVAGLAEKL